MCELQKKEKLLRKGISDLDALLWKRFAKYIKLRDSNPEGMAYCISCPRHLHISEADAGHYYSREFPYLKFEEANVHLQCRICNRAMAGNPKGFKHGLVRKYDFGILLWLEARKHKHRGWLRIDFAERILYYDRIIPMMEKLKKSGQALPAELFAYDLQ